jgi:hypothetical protein
MVSLLDSFSVERVTVLSVPRPILVEKQPPYLSKRFSFDIMKTNYFVVALGVPFLG